MGESEDQKRDHKERVECELSVSCMLLDFPANFRLLISLLCTTTVFRPISKLYTFSGFKQNLKSPTLCIFSLSVLLHFYVSLLLTHLELASKD